MPRMSADQRRTALVEAALAVAEREGLAAATTRAIVAEADMPLASFHYAVDTREDLLRDLVSLVVQREHDAMDPSVAFGEPTLELAIRAALGGYLQLVREHPGLEQTMFELTQHALRSDTLGDLPAAQYAAYRELAAQLLGAAADRFDVRWAVPTDRLAGLVVALTDGMTLAWLADRDDAIAESTLELAASALLAHAIPSEPSAAAPSAPAAPPAPMPADLVPVAAR